MPQGKIITKLAFLLKLAGVDKETGLTISLRLRKPGKAEQMIEWLEQNETATPAEICAKTREIAKDMPPNYTDLLEKEYAQNGMALDLISKWRAEGMSDQNIYENLESFF